MSHSHSALTRSAVFLLLCGTCSFAAQKPAPQTGSGTQQPVQTQAITPTLQGDSADDNLPKAIGTLTEQMKLLITEVRRLRRVNERLVASLEVVQLEDRLSRVEERITEAQEKKAQLDAREHDLQYRLRNIQMELVWRGGIRREEAEAAARADLQRALDDVRRQQQALSERVQELQSQAASLRKRINAIRPAAESEGQPDR